MFFSPQYVGIKMEKPIHTCSLFFWYHYTYYLLEMNPLYRLILLFKKLFVVMEISALFYTFIHNFNHVRMNFVWVHFESLFICPTFVCIDKEKLMHLFFYDFLIDIHNIFWRWIPQGVYSIWLSLTCANKIYYPYIICLR